MSLANSHKEDGSGPILGIIRTNSLGIMFRDSEADNEFGTGYAAIPRIGSRFNHRLVPLFYLSQFVVEIYRGSFSCTPDVHAEFLPKAFAFQYTAVRDTKAGSEI